MIIAIDARPLVMRQIGGAEQHARNIVSQWATMSTPHLFLLLVDKSQTDPTLYDMTFIDALPKHFQAVSISDFHLSPRWYRGSRLFHSLGRALSRHGADVYHSFSPMVPQTSVCPVVQTVHDLSFELDPVVRRRPESRDLRRIARLGSSWAHHVIAVSGQTRNDIASLYGVPVEQITVVPNGINPVFVPRVDVPLRQALKERFRIGYPYVIAVGSDIPRRNYARVLQAMEMVWERMPEMSWLLAGQNKWEGTPLFEAVSDQARRRMVFVQGPTNAELAQLYRDASVTCCASSFEGFGMSVLESMACGTPVVCSDMRSLREVAQEAAVYFPHDDPQAMGESLVGLLEDVEYRRQLKYWGLQRASNYTWPAAARAILSLLERIGSAK